MERQVRSALLCVCLVFVVFASLSLAGESSSKSTQTDPPSAKWINWSKLEVVDFLRAGALVVAFAFAAFWDSASWPCFDSVLCIGSGLGMYFFPHALMSYQTTLKLNVFHEYLGQTAGAALITQGVVTHCLELRTNNCVMVKHSWILARLLALPVIFIIHCHLHFVQNVMTDQHLLFGMLTVVLWICGTILFMYRSMHETSRSRSSVMMGDHDCLTMHLLVQLLLMLPVFGALMFPETIVNAVVKNGDVLHYNQYRALGGAVLIPFFMTLLGLFYSNDKDKKTLLRGQLLVTLLFAPLLVLHYWRSNFIKRDMFLFALGYQSVAFGNAYVGVYGLPIGKCKRN